MPTDGSQDSVVSEVSFRPGVTALVSRALGLVQLPARALPKPAEPAVFKELCAMILQNPAVASHDIAAFLRSKGLSDARIVDDYIPVCARALGENWLSDDLPFAQVSMGTARLQDLLRHLNDDPPQDLIAPKGFALLVVGEQEQHTLGGFVLAHQLRRQGVDVRILLGPSTKEVARFIKQGGLDVIMFSCAGPASLTSIKTIVGGLKGSFAQVPPMLLGGPIVDGLEDLAEQTGVDLVLTGQSEMLPLFEHLATNKLTTP